MRKYRYLIALITFLCLFFELCEPSTNFIRTGPSPHKHHNLPFDFHGDSAPTHAAQVALPIRYDFKPFYAVIYNDHFQQPESSGYLDRIFQPPKNS